MANSAQLNQLLTQLRNTHAGSSIDLPPLLPNFSTEPVKAFLVEKEDNHWTLACYWMGVGIGDVQASLQGGHLTLEAI